MGLAGSRTSHVRVEINGDYMGAYLNTEHFDEEFVEEYYDGDDGNFYKCLWPMTLEYISQEPDDYKFEVNGRRAYELKTNDELDDYTDIAEFIDILNNTPDADLPCVGGGVQRGGFPQVQAHDVVSGNWDGYAGNKNNFYLYHNPQTGLFDYIPYDLDNTWGIDWLNQDWETRDPYTWSMEYRPLYDRLMAIPEYRGWYTHYLRRMIEEWAHPDSVLAYLEPRHTMLLPEVAEDGYYPLSFGFTYDDFEQSLDQASGGHVEYGILPWLDTRLGSLAGASSTRRPRSSWCTRWRTMRPFSIPSASGPSSTVVETTSWSPAGSIPAQAPSPLRCTTMASTAIASPGMALGASRFPCSGIGRRWTIRFRPPAPPASSVGFLVRRARSRWACPPPTSSSTSS